MEDARRLYGTPPRSSQEMQQHSDRFVAETAQSLAAIKMEAELRPSPVRTVTETTGRAISIDPVAEQRLAELRRALREITGKEPRPLPRR